MDTYTSTEAKREFGEVIMKAQLEPVYINRNGKVVAVVLSASEYELLSALKEEHLTRAIKKGVAEYRVGDVSHADSVFKRLRKKVDEE